jgi:hypothetical protein
MMIRLSHRSIRRQTSCHQMMIRQMNRRHPIHSSFRRSSHYRWIRRSCRRSNRYLMIRRSIRCQMSFHRLIHSSFHQNHRWIRRSCRY